MPDFREKHFRSAKIRFDLLAEDVAILKICGEFDHAVHAEASNYLHDCFSGRKYAVVVDMHDLTFMDSSGVKLLTSLTEQFGFENVAIAGANEDLMRIISLVALDKKLAILKSPEEVERWSNGFRQAA